MLDSGVEKRIRIAILGGGLTGATLVRSLISYAHLDVQLYESAPEFGEIDSATEIATNGQRALQAISPEIYGVLEKAGAVPMNSTRTVIVSLHRLSKASKF
jgi:salicylate hydroxylase